MNEVIKMKFRRLFSYTFFFLFLNSIYAQETKTLSVEDAVSLAKENNVMIQITRQLTELTLQFP